MQKIIKIYKEDLSESLDKIGRLLEKMDMNDFGVRNHCNEILSLSCENIVEKWLVGRKYIRTLFVKEAFANLYPKEVTRISIYIDTIINILDDLLDEKIDDENKKLYILEFLRVFSLYNYNHPPKEVQIYLGNYFNKLISLAVVENCYKNLASNKNKIKEIARCSIKVLDCRSMDIDIFNEIAILRNCCNYTSIEKEKIIKAGRIFRAVNIMKKDIEDLDYDKKTGQDSVISKIADKEKYNLHEYALLISNHYLSEADKIKATKQVSAKCMSPVNNFYNMIKKDRDKIIKLVNRTSCL